MVARIYNGILTRIYLDGPNSDIFFLTSVVPTSSFSTSMNICICTNIDIHTHNTSYIYVPFLLILGIEL